MTANHDRVEHEKGKMMQHFKCDDVGPLEDYIGCKVDIDREKRSLKMTQPVLVQSLHQMNLRILSREKIR